VSGRERVGIAAAGHINLPENGVRISFGRIFLNDAFQDIFGFGELTVGPKTSGQIDLQRPGRKSRDGISEEGPGFLHFVFQGEDAFAKQEAAADGGVGFGRVQFDCFQGALSLSLSSVGRPGT